VSVTKLSQHRNDGDLYPGKKASRLGFSLTGFEGGHGGCASDGGGEGHEDGEDGGGGLHVDDDV
jgi:hypothetical protein